MDKVPPAVTHTNLSQADQSPPVVMPPPNPQSEAFRALCGSHVVNGANPNVYATGTSIERDSDNVPTRLVRHEDLPPEAA